MSRLDAVGIDSRPFFYPLSALPAFAALPDTEVARELNHVSYAIAPYGINLPSALRLTEDDIDRVCRELKVILDAVSATA